MKARISLAIVALTCAAQVQASGDISGRTFYQIRPEFQSARPERVGLFRQDRAKEESNRWRSSFQVVPFGGKSTRPKELGKYFMFCGKSELDVASQASFGVDINANPNLRDVNALHFNIGDQADQQFRSVISFRPRHSFIGGGLQWRQYLGNCPCPDLNLWFEASTAVMHVRNDMRLEEKIITPKNNRDARQNFCMTEAFCGEKPFFVSASAFNRVVGQGWKYGKIKGKQSTTKLSDVELKLGYEWFCDDTTYLEGYFGVVVPVGNKPTAEFVFEPLVGHHHFGIMWGKAFGMDIYCCEDTTVRAEFEYNGRYLFSNKHLRSFDIKNKPWSRYMLVRKSEDQFDATEGINVFTREMKVRPRFAHTFNAAFVMKNCDFEGEVGYNMWVRQQDKVELTNPETFKNIAFYGVAADGQLTGDISRAIAIGENFPGTVVGYTTNRTLTTDDIDFNSAAHPCALSHTLYASAGYHIDRCGRPTLVGLGASYEFSGVNTALSRWTVWGKLGMSF